MPRTPWSVVLVISAIVLGGIAEHVLPLGLPGPTSALSALRIVGYLLVGAALLVDFVCFGFFHNHGTTVLPHRQAKALVTDGLYRFSRNPMYVAHVALVLGMGLVTSNPWTIALATLVFALTDRLAIRPEEAFLEEKFGDAYRDYCTRVRRWI